MFIKGLKDYKDKQATLKGWIYNFRSSWSIICCQLINFYISSIIHL